MTNTNELDIRLRAFINAPDNFLDSVALVNALHNNSVLASDQPYTLEIDGQKVTPVFSDKDDLETFKTEQASALQQNWVERSTVISGAGGSLFEDAIAQGADCLLTGEANHHHAIDAKRLGLSLIAAGHYATEFPVTAAVAEKLRRAFPELEVLVSEDARDPYTYL